MMRKAKEWVATLVVSHPAAKDLIIPKLGMFRVNLVHHVMSKPVKDRRIFKSLEEVASAFARQILAIAPEADGVPFALLDETVTNELPKTTAVREYSDEGLTLASVADLGFKVNVNVSDGKAVYKISTITLEKVVLTPSAGGSESSPVEITLVELVDAYKIHVAPTSELVPLNSLPDAAEHPEVKTEHWKSLYKLGLLKAFKQCTRSLVVQKGKADRKVLAGGVIAAGDVVSVPFNFVISNAKKDGEVPQGSIPLGCHDDMTFFVSRRETWPADEIIEGSFSKAVKPFVVPFWCMRVVQRPEEATLKMTDKIFAVDGIDLTIPVLIAETEIAKDAELTYYKTKKPEPTTTKGAGKGKGRGAGKGGGKGAKGAAEAKSSSVATKGKRGSGGSATGRPGKGKRPRTS